MEVNVLENKGGKLRIEVKGEGHTLLNLLRKNACLLNARQASYIIDHPQVSQPVFVVYDKEAKKVVVDAAKMIVSQVEEFEKGFERAITKK